MAALEFCLPPGALPGLLRKSVFGRRTGRTAAVEMVWHDTASGTLAADRLSLCETGPLWRLERLAPRAGELWAPGIPAPLVAETAEFTQLGLDIGPLVPVAGFRGEHCDLRIGSEPAVTLSILNGVLRGVAHEQPVCRLILQGPVPALMALTTEWAAGVPITIPLACLAAEALGLVHRTAPLPRRSGPPVVMPGMTVADAMALIVGHLTDTILAGMQGASAGDSAEPVHTLRVAVRRLRSAVSVFRRAFDTPVLAELKAGLAQLAQTLGAARDWDVFLDGIVHDLAAALPDDRRIAAVRTGAMRQRTAAYAALRAELASPAFRQFTMRLVQMAALRPWQMDLDAEQAARLEADMQDFASETLTRQYRQLLAPGPDLGALPADQLHAVRKLGKKMRYTADFVAPLYGRRRTRRFIQRLADLQEALGQSNDGATAAVLAGSLQGGAGRQFAMGAIQGFAAARGNGARKNIAKSWNAVGRAKPFWL